MIEITFSEFYQYKYHEDGFHELYVMKNGLGEILYVGISSQNIWNRWFGWNGHISGDAKHMVGESDIGRKVVNHFPDSWDWKIQLWTLDDCTSFCADELGLHGEQSVKWLEPIMIRKLHPSMNIMNNLNPGIDHTTKSEQEKKREAELDKAYYEVFEKKTE